MGWMILLFAVAVLVVAFEMWRTRTGTPEHAIRQLRLQPERTDLVQAWILSFTGYNSRKPRGKEIAVGVCFIRDLPESHVTELRRLIQEQPGRVPLYFVEAGAMPTDL